MHITIVEFTHTAFNLYRQTTAIHDIVYISNAHLCLMNSFVVMFRQEFLLALNS